MFSQINLFSSNKICFNTALPSKALYNQNNKDVFIKSSDSTSFQGKKYFNPEKTEETRQKGCQIEADMATKTEPIYRQAYDRIANHIEEKAAVLALGDDKEELFDALNEVTSHLGDCLLVQGKPEEAVKIAKQSLELFKNSSAISEKDKNYITANQVLNNWENIVLQKEKQEIDQQEMEVEDEIDTLTAIPAESISKDQEIVEAYSIASRRIENDEYRLNALDTIEDKGAFNVIGTLAMANIDDFMNEVTLEALKPHAHKPEVIDIITKISLNHCDERIQKKAGKILSSQVNQQKNSN